MDAQKKIGKAAKAKPKKRGRGQPTKYRREYCELLIAHRTKGLSFESFGATVVPPVHRDTLYEWVNTHPEFSDAKKIANEFSQLFWEKLMARGTNGEIPYFNVVGAIFSMKAMHGIVEPKDPLSKADDNDPTSILRKAAAALEAEAAALKGGAR